MRGPTVLMSRVKIYPLPRASLTADRLARFSHTNLMAEDNYRPPYNALRMMELLVTESCLAIAVPN